MSKYPLFFFVCDMKNDEVTLSVFNSRSDERNKRAEKLRSWKNEKIERKEIEKIISKHVKTPN